MYDILSGVRVVELSTWTMVPSCGAVCAEWGADVIKVEHPKGDPQRKIRFTPSATEPAAMTMTHLPNRGKRSITLDLHAERGRDVLLRLVETADVFLTNFLAPARRKLRIDVADLRRVNPGLVYAKATGQGPQGPDADLGGYDISAGWARPSMAHQMMAFGADEPPAMPPGLVDLQAGFNLAAGIAGALFKRERTGRPSVVDVSLLSAALWMLGPNLSAASYDSEILHATGRYDPAHGPLTNSYRTLDGRWLYLVFIEPDRYWQDFCRRIDRPDLAADPRFETAEVRARHVKECVDELESVFATRTLAQWRDAFDGMEGPWAPVQSAAETLRDPQVLANGYIGRAGTGEQEFALVSSPVQFDVRPVGPVSLAPAVGEHTEAVLDSLGYDEAAIEALRGEGVLG
ncbi:CaiB/BaiF CoA transferase family protein [Dactylosporangium sp. CA-092794]|uniref:CaiB/BaiF CoA transferase family protein n=1 Tax=Dactylosporangium sp. CA-092794 TaxID=3239929 RepID=UPI003D8FF28B